LVSRLFRQIGTIVARPKKAAPFLTQRPSGDLVWLHLCAPQHSAAADVLAQRLMQGCGLHVLVTGGQEAGGQAAGGQAARKFSGAYTDTVPLDRPAAVQAFLAHWSPQVIVMMGATLRPALIAAAKAQNRPLILIEASGPALLAGMNPFGFGALARAVRAFRAIMTVDEASARSYRKLGAGNVARLGRIQQGSHALPHNEPERAALAATFATRPVWLAVDVPAAEEAAVIAAHRAALRLAHRLLLILVPQEPARMDALATYLEQTEGWIVARRDQDQEPDAETAVYIADAGQEYGLWYRLAPVTFMGGSLFGAGCARSPMEPAALGSAIIHGRKVGGFGLAFGRLGASLGAAPVGSAKELADALADLQAPDRAARLAHAAWGVTSEGAEAVDRIVQTIVQSIVQSTAQSPVQAIPRAAQSEA
jgi:3-deoxy-D-manno-octulosonic-acid transferase